MRSYYDFPTPIPDLHLIDALIIGAALTEFFALVRVHYAFRNGWDSGISCGMDYDLYQREMREC